jgi:hypothetical protein
VGLGSGDDLTNRGFVIDYLYPEVTPLRTGNAMSPSKSIHDKIKEGPHFYYGAAFYCDGKYVCRVSARGSDPDATRKNVVDDRAERKMLSLWKELGLEAESYQRHSPTLFEDTDTYTRDEWVDGGGHAWHIEYGTHPDVELNAKYHGGV